MKKEQIVLSLICGSILLISISFLFGYVTKSSFLARESERVVLLDWGFRGETAHLLSMDINGTHLQEIEGATGTTAWSKDGRYIATGCVNKSLICIYEWNNFFDMSKYPPILPTQSDNLEITLPKECQNVLNFAGLSSISWSNDEKRLIVVCQDQKKSNICIINLDGTSQCWGEKTGDDIYSKADWSPINDSIVIDTGNQVNLLPGKDQSVNAVRTGRVMQIVDPQGNLLNSLVDGWSPTWSPKGTEIAFIRWDDERGFPGIASIQPDGTNFHWIYRPPLRGSGGDLSYYKPIFDDVFDCRGASKISWSPDQKYLVVEASVEEDCSFWVFRIEVKTGEITNLTTDLSSSYQEPSIQP